MYIVQVTLEEIPEIKINSFQSGKNGNHYLIHSCSDQDFLALLLIGHDTLSMEGHLTFTVRLTCNCIISIFSKIMKEYKYELVHIYLIINKPQKGNINF